MNKRGSNAITATILLAGFILISVMAAAVITNGSEGTTPSEEEVEEIIDDVLNEITTYLQIKDKIGKYYIKDDIRQIEKIAILAKPLISTNIDVSQLTIKLCDGYHTKFLNYSKNANFIGSKNLFEHPLWKQIGYNNFGFLIMLDEDKSLVEDDILNKDMTYIIIKLPEDFIMTHKEILTMTIFPESGIERTIFLKAPPPIKPVVTFE